MIPKIPSYVYFAINELGTREIAGNEDNSQILEYLDSVKIIKGHDEIPWCSGFINWVMIQDGLKGTNKANARSWLDWGVAIDKPQVGAVVVFKRGLEAWQGHVAILLDWNEEYFIVIGGNQSNKVGIAYLPRDKVLGMRMEKKNES